MNRLTRLLVSTQLTRNKVRVGLLLLAIVAASCLVVWTVGGYQSLFTEAMKRDARPLGRYDLKIGAEQSRGPGGMARQGGGAFPGPLSSRNAGGGPATGGPGQSVSEKSQNAAPEPGRGGMGVPGAGRGGRGRPGSESNAARPKFDPLEKARVRDGSIVLERLPEDLPTHLRAKLEKADRDQNGVITLAEERTFYSAGAPETSAESGLTLEFVEKIRADQRVRGCDAMRQVRSFVFSPKAKQNAFVEKNRKNTETPENLPSDDLQYEESVPDGIDPTLHRAGMSAYRAAMGTPMSLGAALTGTDAEIPPFELEEGRWFRAETPDAAEAVLGKSAAERYNVQPGDRLWFLTKNDEFQVNVVGILDTENESDFYISEGFADRIASDGAKKIDSLGISLNHSEDAESFQSDWNAPLQAAAPTLSIMTNAEAAARQSERFAAANTFRLQAAAGSLLAILASVMIIFTALSIGVEERRREIALLRSIGLTRRQIAASILSESLFLAVPGWLGGLAAGWLILAAATGKPFGLNGTVVGFSFLCAVIGSLLAAFFPMLKACRVRPLEAAAEARDESFDRFSAAGRNFSRLSLAVLGILLIGADLGLVYFAPGETARRAALHSGIGIAALAAGVLCLLPTLLRFAENALLPILAAILRFDRTVSATELSSHLRRSVGVTAMLAVGGGLFVLMQVWGYSMLEPFLPNRQMPDAFVSFLPTGLDDEHLAELKKLPGVLFEEFEPVALEQAAFAPDALPSGKTAGSFANVIFFGMDVDRSFAGKKPLVKLQFVEGDPSEAFAAMKSGRGVIINDAVTVDYGLHAGDTLQVSDPKNPSRILEYPVVGVTKFNGWQWLSKTGGVRRNFGRSGGMVFASEKLIQDDFHLSRPSCFWFNTAKGTEYSTLEKELDALARRNFEAIPAEERRGNSVYVKLSTRESLYDSIAGRADSVIWGMSVMPLVTLLLTSIALIAVTVNSVRSRRRWFGIMRAVGVERSKMFRMILAESILLGLTAAAASLLFGIPAAAGALKLGQSMFGTADPAMILPVRGLLFGLGALIMLSVAAAVYPAFKIARSKPLDLLSE